MSTKTAPSSNPCAQPPPDPYYAEIAIQAQRMADEKEGAPTLPDVPPLPPSAPPPAPPERDREGWLVRVCIVVSCAFIVALCIAAVLWRHGHRP